MLSLKLVEEYLFTATNGQEKRTHEVYSWVYINPILNDQFLQLQENDGGLLFNGIKYRSKGMSRRWPLRSD